jgi:hypothetical protein
LTVDGRERWWRRYVWPRGVGVGTDVVALSQLLLVAIALGAVAIDATGWFDVGDDRFGQLVTAIAALVLLGFTLEAGERRAFARRHEELFGEVRALGGALEVRQIASNAIGPGIRDELTRSGAWLFRGGSGRFLRSGTLPELGNIRNREVPVMIQVLDPRDEFLCTKYAEYRSVQRGAVIRRPDEGDMRKIQADLLASIYAAAWYSARTRIEASVTLLRTISPIRYDFGDRGLYVTVADPTQPGLFAQNGSWYYNSVRDELEQANHGHPSVQFSRDIQLFPTKDEVDGVIVERGLDAIRIHAPDGAETPLLTGAADAHHLDFADIAARVFPSE